MDKYIESLSATEYVQIVLVGLFSIALAGLFHELKQRRKGDISNEKNNEE